MELSQLIEGLLQPFFDPGSRTWWGGLLVFVLAAAVFAGLRPAGWLPPLRTLLRHPSTGLDVQLYLGRRLLRVFLGAPSVLGAFWLATHGVRLLDRILGVPVLPELPPLLISLLFSIVLFVAWDLSRYLLHRAMHEIPVLWAFHQVHHSAEMLSPLTFHRIHPVESMLYRLRGLLVTGPVTALFFWLFRERATDLSLLGVPALGLLFNVATGNLRHSHVFLRFPAPLERWLLSPAQHQLHHSAEPEHLNINYGTWLSVWDRLGGSLRIAERPPRRFGIPEAGRNHGNDLLSAWLGPFLDLLRGLRSRRLPALSALLLLPALPVRAEEPPPEEEEDDGEVGASIIVYSEDGTPRVAGSAQALDEEDLERFEYNDIERVLATQVPGVTVRSEDGFGLRPNIGIRGANSDRSAKITLMEDGVLLAPAPYAAPAAYYFPMPTRMVGVEVFKGAAATRHGPNTVGGAINLLTRDVPRELDYSLDLAGGTYGSAKAHGWFGSSGDHLGALFEGVHLRSSGFKELDNGGPTGFQRSELMLKTLFRPSTVHRLELKLGYGNETSNETYLGLTLADLEATPYRRYAASQLDQMRWNRSQAELSWSFRPDRRFSARTVAYHHYLDRTWTKLNRFAGGPDLHTLLQEAPTTGQGAVYLAILRGEESSASPEQLLQIGTNDRQFQAMGIQSTARLELIGENVSNTIEAGLRLHADDVWRLHTEDPHAMTGGRLVPEDLPELTLLDAHSTARALAAHLHDDLEIGRLHLLPGGRVEVIRTEEVAAGIPSLDPITRTVLLPGGAALYEVTPWFHAFAGVHRGFSPVAPGQPEEVEPELSWNYEAGLRLDEGDRRAELVGFVNDYTNLTGQCTLSGGCDGSQIDQQYNGGAVWVYGLEASGRVVMMLPGSFTLPFEASYTWTASRFQTDFVSAFPQFGTVYIDDSLPYLPEHQGSARATLAHPRFELSVGGTAHGGMLNEAGRFPVTDTDIPPIFLLDAAGRVQLTPWLELYSTASNLLGSTAITSWRPFGARPTAPFQVWAGIKLMAPEEDGPGAG